MILDFLNGRLPWANFRDTNTDEVKLSKAKCLNDPAKHLWTNPITNTDEIRKIFKSISELKYEDRPNYEYIRIQLTSLLKKERAKEFELKQLETKTSFEGKRKLNTSIKIIEEPPKKLAIFNIEKYDNYMSSPDIKYPFKIDIDKKYYDKVYLDIIH